MKGQFADEFLDAAVTEIQTLEEMDAWNVVYKLTDKSILDSTWAFRFKRYPDALIKKFKARFCDRGDQ